jgi:hypothetical protein
MNAGSIDIHKIIGKFWKPKQGWVLPNYKYCGPYNPLEMQVDSKGKPLPGHEPYNQVDDICRQHDIAYDNANNKNDKHEADKVMLQNLRDMKPANLREKFDRTMLRGIIGAKYKLGFGLTNAQEKLLKDIYYNPKTGYSGATSLARHAKVKLRDTKEFLTAQETYTKHKPAKQAFQRRRVIVHNALDQFQADLVDMRNLKSNNDNVNYILTVIDVLTKYAYAIPIKHKTGDEVTKAFAKIFRDKKPKMIQTDKGTEFINKVTQKLFTNEGVHWFTTENETKAQIVERFNRTLKEKMYRYFTANKTKRWINVLNDLVSNYNNSYHRSIKMTPAEAVNNPDTAWRNLYSKTPLRREPKFSVGQFVRISLHREKFKRGYLANYSDEIFVITEVLPTVPVTNRITDIGADSDDIVGTFYEEELSLFKPKTISQVI